MTVVARGMLRAWSDKVDQNLAVPDGFDIYLEQILPFFPPLLFQKARRVK